MRAVVAGDIVETSSGGFLGLGAKKERKVVVDVSPHDGDDYLVLRDEDDLEGLHLDAVPAKDVTVVGHLQQLAGWVEYEPGKWKKT